MVRTKTTRSAWLRISLMICVAMLGVQTVLGQHAFEYAARIGANDLHYKTEYGKHMPNYNVGMDFAWKWRSPYYIGARVGLGVDVAASTFVGYDKVNGVSGYTDTYKVPEWYEYDHHEAQVDYKLGRFTETQQMIIVSVPAQLGLYFGNFSVFFGGRFGTAVHGCYWQRIKDANLTITYPSMLGETIVIGENTSGKVDPVTGEAIPDPLVTRLAAGNFAKTTNGIRELSKDAFPLYSYHITAMVDVNYSFKVGDNTEFAIGAYLEYDPIGYEPKASSDNTTSLMEWHYTAPNETSNIPVFRRDYTSVLESYRGDGVSMRQADDAQGARVVSKFNRASVGLRLSVSLWSVPIDFGTNYRKQQHYKTCMCDFF